MNRHQSLANATAPLRRGFSLNRILWGLLAVNLILLASLALRRRPNLAGASPRARSEYIMVPGVITSSPNDVVYVIDTSDGLLSAVTYDSTGQRLIPMPPINLDNIFYGTGSPRRAQ